MKIGVLKQFSTDLLSERLEHLGFQRRGNSWYKIVPDVILCAEVRSLRGKAFDVCFGIVPFVCYDNCKLNLSCFQPESAYSRAFCDMKRSFYSEMYERPVITEPGFFFSIDSTERELKDDRKYQVFLKYWGDIYEKAIAPFLLKVTDLNSAVEAIGEYSKFESHRVINARASDDNSLYLPYHAPIFMKLGEVEKAKNCLHSFISIRIEDDGEEQIELEARDALDSGNIGDMYLWYKLLKDNDIEGMKKLVAALEGNALAWIEKEKLTIEK